MFFYIICLSLFGSLCLASDIPGPDAIGDARVSVYEIIEVKKNEREKTAGCEKCTRCRCTRCKKRDELTRIYELKKKREVGLLPGLSAWPTGGSADSADPEGRGGFSFSTY